MGQEHPAPDAEIRPRPGASTAPTGASSELIRRTTPPLRRHEVLRGGANYGGQSEPTERFRLLADFSMPPAAGAFSVRLRRAQDPSHHSPAQ